MRTFQRVCLAACLKFARSQRLVGSLKLLCALICWSVVLQPTSKLFVTTACAQDFFNPPPTVVATRAPVRNNQQVFSFTRLEPDLHEVCSHLELEGRRERLLSIADGALKAERKCVTCRAFWRSMVTACQRPKKEEKVTPQPYPGTVLLDVASRVSTKSYELDPGQGATAQMFQLLAKTVLSYPELNQGEREYFDVFLSYLLAAWDGRIDPAKLPPPTPILPLDQVFDFSAPSLAD